MPSVNQSTFWTAILYPDSLPSGWRDTLKNIGLPVYLSPLHQPDSEDGEGAQKKPHYHLLYALGSSVSARRATAAIWKLSPGFLKPEPAYHRHALERYFVHMDNPEKEQFEQENYGETWGGYVVDYNAPDIAMFDIVNMIVREEITSLIELYGYLSTDEYGYLADYVVKHQADVIAVLNDNHYRIKEGGLDSSK